MFEGTGGKLCRGLVAAFGLCLLVGAGLGAWGLLTHSVPPPVTEGAVAGPLDPRVIYQGPFQNIHPDAGYVGRDRCRGCHKDIARAFEQSPMGRSLVPIAELADSQKYVGHNNPFEALDCFFTVEHKGGKVLHRIQRRDRQGKSVFEQVQEVHYALGSGSHAYSYLTKQDGFLTQSAISWQSRRKSADGKTTGMWVLSPGFELLGGRPTGPECFFCHTDRIRYRPGTLNAYDEPIFLGHGIGCERCHGAGEKHVRSPGHFQTAPWSEKTEIDPTIVHPGKLPPDLREAVCQQCHLEGAARVLRRGRDLYDFRPGLPLDDFWSIFVRETDEHKKAVNHVEQMYQSVCFQRSSENHKLGCISCHNPHYQVPVSERVAHYRERCLRCHTDASVTAGEGPQQDAVPRGGYLAGCSLPLAKRPGNSCIACHMPPYATSDFEHAAATEHRILRKARGDLVRPDASGPSTPGGGRLSLVHFRRGRVTPDDPELLRDLAVGLVTLSFKEQVEPPLMAGALTQLDAAVLRDAADTEAWSKRGVILWRLQRQKEALKSFEKVLARLPQEEQILFMAGLLHRDLGQAEPAVEISRRAKAINPYRTAYRVDLAEIFLFQQKWQEALQESREVVDLDPLNLDLHKLLVLCLLRAGKPAEAEAELERPLAVVPAGEVNEWRQWFTRLRNR